MCRVFKAFGFKKRNRFSPPDIHMLSHPSMNQSTEVISFSNGQVIWTYIFLSAVVLLIVLNNGLILTAVLSQRRLHSQISVLILGSLSFAQLLGGLLAIPTSAALVQDYRPGRNGLKFNRVVVAFCGVASQLHLTLLCVDRCYALLDSMLRGNLRRRNIIVAVIVAWILSIVAASLLLIEDFKNYSIFLVTTFFLIPLLIDVLGYILIYRTSCRIGKQNQITTLWRKELRLAKSFAIITLLFTLFWLPYVVTSLLHDHCSSCDATNSHVLLLVWHCQFLSLAFSSIVYYNGSLDFRLAFKKIAKELRNFLRERVGGGRDDIAQDSPSPAQNNNGGRKASSKRREVLGHVNSATFLNQEEESAQKKGATSRQPQNDNHLSGVTSKDEVHIIPFDQARFFDPNGQNEERPRSGNETSEILAFDIPDLEEDSVEEGRSSVGFHDIEIVPYDQSC